VLLYGISEAFRTFVAKFHGSALLVAMRVIGHDPVAKFHGSALLVAMRVIGYDPEPVRSTRLIFKS